MKRLIGFCAAALVVPVTAGAQVYPERIPTLERSARATLLISNYQGGDRRGNREEQVDRTTRTFKLGETGVLALGNIAGDIAITRATGADTTVEIVKTARGRDVNNAREMLQLVQVDVTERAGRADIRTRYPRNINVSVAYNVTAPEGTRITVESISGSVTVADIRGDLSANTISGNIRIRNAGRVSTAKTISGTVEITDAKMDGALESSSVSGDVIVRRVAARRISANSVSGHVKFDDLDCERVSAKSISGTVNYVGGLAKTGRYELVSLSGEVRLFLSGGVGFEVEANSVSGSVSSDFDIVSRVTPGDRRGRRTSLIGTFGDGSAVLDLTTFSGSIVISKR